jgi:hypothetical protein
VKGPCETDALVTPFAANALPSGADGATIVTLRGDGLLFDEDFLILQRGCGELPAQVRFASKSGHS